MRVVLLGAETKDPLSVLKICVLLYHFVTLERVTRLNVVKISFCLYYSRFIQWKNSYITFPSMMNDTIGSMI